MPTDGRYCSRVLLELVVAVCYRAAYTFEKPANHPDVDVAESFIKYTIEPIRRTDVMHHLTICRISSIHLKLDHEL